MMKIVFYLMILMIFQGCGGSDENKSETTTTTPNTNTQTDTEIVVTSGEMSLESGRKFSYTMPQNKIVPLIIALHGGGGSAKNFEEYSGFSTLSHNKKSFGVVYPEGKNKHWNDGRAIQDNSVDDVAFLKEIVAFYKEKNYTEFYFVGNSNGGLMALRMAGEASEDMSGIGVVSAIESEFSDIFYTDTKPMKALFILGTLDTVFLPAGKITEPIRQIQDRGEHITTEVMLEKWRLRNGCESLETIETLNKIEEDNTTVEYQKGLNCTDALGYYKINGGGHRWPDTKASNEDGVVRILNLGFASREISTAQSCLDFFEIK